MASRERSPEQRTVHEDHPHTPAPSAVGACRRLRALAARSWSPQAVEQETGIPAPQVRRALDGYEITPELAAAVGGAYDRLWDRDPPTATRADRKAARAARSGAAQRGWAPPLAWDDDQIDLSHGRPAEGWRPTRHTRRSVDLVEDVRFLRQHGGFRDASMAEVAARLGVSRNVLDQAQVRARRYAARSADRDAIAEMEAEAG
jgi:hypothetical protein